MNTYSLIMVLIIGGIAGWLAGGLLGTLVMATLGAVMLLYVVKMFKKV